MKYMGSKRWMLGNGLGELLTESASKSDRFVDLFSGSGAVAIYVATRLDVPVHSSDLQRYGMFLSGAVIERTVSLNSQLIWDEWKTAAEKESTRIREIPAHELVTRKSVDAARAWCSSQTELAITHAYGGHYFSPQQSVWFDVLRRTVPVEPMSNSVAIASLVEAAAQCAAAPGHTAQPFQPTRTAKPYLAEAWGRDVLAKTKQSLAILCKQHARVEGRAVVADALEYAKNLTKGDVVFVDPPYSGVHYSRFYHVLETVATGGCQNVSGVGRYPSAEFRPRSDFSVSSKSRLAFDALFQEIATRGASAIVTFPEHKCSNGVSGRTVARLAQKYFLVRQKSVTSKFSTLGGTSGASGLGGERAARQSARELILHLRPRSRSRRVGAGGG